MRSSSGLRHSEHRARRPPARRLRQWELAEKFHIGSELTLTVVEPQAVSDLLWTPTGCRNLNARIGRSPNRSTLKSRSLPPPRTLGDRTHRTASTASCARSAHGAPIGSNGSLTRYFPVV